MVDRTDGRFVTAGEVFCSRRTALLLSAVLFFCRARNGFVQHCMSTPDTLSVHLPRMHVLSNAETRQLHPPVGHNGAMLNGSLGQTKGPPRTCRDRIGSSRANSSTLHLGSLCRAGFLDRHLHERLDFRALHSKAAFSNDTTVQPYRQQLTGGEICDRSHRPCGGVRMR